MIDAEITRENPLGGRQPHPSSGGSLEFLACSSILISSCFLGRHCRDTDCLLDWRFNRHACLLDSRQAAPYAAPALDRGMTGAARLKLSTRLCLGPFGKLDNNGRTHLDVVLGPS